MLKKNSYIPSILSNHQDGVDYISIVNPSTELGKMLAPEYTFEFDTVFGKVISIRRLMEYLNRDKYPSRFLSKSKLTHRDINEIKQCTIKHIENYWVYILYGVIKRISSDDKLISLIKDNDLDFVALDTKLVSDTLFDKEVSVKKHLTKFSYYVSCLRIVTDLIKSDKLNDNEHVSMLLDNEINGNFLNEVSKLNNVVSIA